MSNTENKCPCKPFFGCVCYNEVPKKVLDVVEAFGGINNILGFNNSVSELRYDVKNVNLVSEEKLKKLGSKKVLILEGAKHIQVELGEIVEELNFEVKKYANLLKSKEQNIEIKSDTNDSKSEKTDVKHSNEMEVLAPVSGEIVLLKDLNDGIFSNNLVGNGLAIKFDLNSSKLSVKAPFKGKVTMLPANKNQFIFNSVCGNELVVILGLDSYKLNGIGINFKVKLNETVEAGQEIVELNLDNFKNENIDNHIVLSTTQFSKLNNISDLANKAQVSEKLFVLK
ncbi:PTS glucose transporter subunit IIA [Mycoplasma leonicaptivi]|uniref:PTS glucose transporter subunit IIA n=1 Tax=Mycoplasma leonicaptivi TaxID=36742 RepID=UPI0004832911|nr:PTS glucose transporter subunit IIA [Mycoplasma leonicaptivi]